MQLKGNRLAKWLKKIDKCLNSSEAFGFDSESLSDAILGCLTDDQPTNYAKNRSTDINESNIESSKKLQPRRNGRKNQCRRESG
jgi:hypothetical protein